MPGIVPDAWNNKTTKENFQHAQVVERTEVKGETPMANNYPPKDKSFNR